MAIHLDFGRMRWGMPLTPLLGLALWASSGCLLSGDSEYDETPVPIVEGDYTVAGTMVFEQVPYSTSGDGLNYDGIFTRPIRGVEVSLMDADSDEELASTISDEEGKYSFAWSGTNHVRLWVYAKTASPSIQVEDNTDGDAIWVLATRSIDATKNGTIDVTADTGWDGREYDQYRHAAPFAVLDAAYTAASRFVKEASPPPSFPALSINWSPDNRPESGNKANGAIGTSHWDGTELYILGYEDVDTDEFDTHITVHEWGHYFESKISRSDSIGGPHGFGDLLDPRVSFGEGWGNALSGIILDPDTRYTDSMGSTQSTGFSFDLEDNFNNADYNPGWYSEESVQSILFDLYDPANKSYDSVALGIDGLYDIMIGAQKTTPAMTTLFSFIAGLKAAHPEQSSAIDSLVTWHSASGDLGIDPIADAWGTGETHDAGISGALPLYLAKTIGSSVTVNFTGGEDYNKLQQERFITFVGDGNPVTVTSTCSDDVDLYVYDSGTLKASAYTYSGNESLTFSSAANKTYVLNVQGYRTANGAYSATISLQH